MNRENSFEEYIDSPIFRWAFEITNQHFDDDKVSTVRSCSILINLYEQLYASSCKLRIFEGDLPTNRLQNLITWLEAIKCFIQNELEMILVCPIPDFNQIAYCIDSEEGMLIYESCLLIMLACFITYAPYNSSVKQDSENDFLLMSTVDMSTILIPQNDKILQLINEDRFKIHKLLVESKIHADKNTDNSDKFCQLHDDVFKSVVSEQASKTLSSSALSEIIEELEVELDNRHIEIKQLNALMSERTTELDQLRLKVQAFEDELAFKISYADHIDNLVEEATRVNYLERKLEQTEKKLKEKESLQMSILEFRTENLKLRKDFEEFKQRQQVKRIDERTQFEAEIKILTERSDHLNKVNIDKTRKLVETEAELTIFRHLSKSGNEIIDSSPLVSNYETDFNSIHSQVYSDLSNPNYSCMSSKNVFFPSLTNDEESIHVQLVDKQCQSSGKLSSSLHDTCDSFTQTENKVTTRKAVQTYKENTEGTNTLHSDIIPFGNMQFHPTFSVVIQKNKCDCSIEKRDCCSVKYSASQIKRSSTKKPEKSSTKDSTAYINEMKDDLNSSYIKLSNEIEELSRRLKDKKKAIVKDMKINLSTDYVRVKKIENNYARKTSIVDNKLFTDSSQKCEAISPISYINPTPIICDTELPRYSRVLFNSTKRQCLRRGDMKLSCTSNKIADVLSPTCLLEEWAQFGCV